MSSRQRLSVPQLTVPDEKYLLYLCEVLTALTMMIIVFCSDTVWLRTQAHTIRTNMLLPICKGRMWKVYAMQSRLHFSNLFSQSPTRTLRASHRDVNFVFTLGTWPSSRKPKEADGAGYPEGELPANYS